MYKSQSHLTGQTKDVQLSHTHFIDQVKELQLVNPISQVKLRM